MSSRAEPDDRRERGEVEGSCVCFQEQRSRGTKHKIRRLAADGASLRTTRD
jgi:hypothetical protein